MLNTCPYLVTFTYQEDFRSLPTANSAILIRLTYPYTAPEPCCNVLKSPNFVEGCFVTFLL